ncbi:Uncharacterised protein [Bordetella pertussis]|nr:Uncharacterised protein [Bordetella pertussis]CFN18293.1 Uncharacterised protein [Bordetella pertussis]CFO03493.1 Uncharacterised protein [Bordetella pertussis]CFO28625.1 Uncharacterised protein [Bordetella pertussis]CPK63643.1 Uncharacterised protein [Bordetella pertussis]
MGRVVAARVGQRQQRRVGLDQQCAGRQFGAQRVDFLQIVLEQHRGLPQQRAFQRGGVDIGIAVAIAADPAAHAQERFERWGRRRERLDGLAVEQPGQVAVDARDDIEEGAAVIGQRVLDLVGHGQPRVAQHARLPQRGDLADQGQVQFGQFVGGQFALALHQQGRDFAMHVQRALALHFGGVGGQHRHHAGLAQQAADPGIVHALRLERFDGLAQAAALRTGAGQGALALAPVLVAVLGDVGQVQEVAERARHRVGVVASQLLDAGLQQLVVGRVAGTTKPDGGAAQGFDRVVHPLALASLDDFAQAPAQQPDIVT